MLRDCANVYASSASLQTLCLQTDTSLCVHLCVLSLYEFVSACSGEFSLCGLSLYMSVNLPAWEPVSEGHVRLGPLWGALSSHVCPCCGIVAKMSPPVAQLPCLLIPTSQ